MLFEVGSAICGAAPNMNAFIIGRAVAGLGVCQISVKAEKAANLAREPVCTLAV